MDEQREIELVKMVCEKLIGPYLSPVKAMTDEELEEWHKKNNIIKQDKNG